MMYCYSDAVSLTDHSASAGSATHAIDAATSFETRREWRSPSQSEKVAARRVMPEALRTILWTLARYRPQRGVG